MSYAMPHIKKTQCKGGSMNEDTMNEREMYVSIGEIPEDEQITVADTGWSKEEKEHMRHAGYDDMDMIRAWYS